MIYFRKNDEVIEKYQVDFDKEEIEKLKKEIINNCSFIHYSLIYKHCQVSIVIYVLQGLAQL